MANNIVTCPACSSSDVTRHENENFGQLTLGPEFSFNEIYYHCNTCNEEGDFLAETDKSYLTAQKDAQANHMKKILEDMNDAGISMAMLERVFELPARTLTRWKGGDFSASALALIRIIITYPWIIEVAENRFERKYANHTLIRAAVNEFMQEAQSVLSTTSQLPQTTAENSIFGTAKSHKLRNDTHQILPPRSGAQK